MRKDGRAYTPRRKSQCVLEYTQGFCDALAQLLGDLDVRIANPIHFYAMEWSINEHKTTGVFVVLNGNP